MRRRPDRWSAILRAALLAATVALATSAAVAQTGGIKVVVTDGDGVPLPGAIVTISHETNFVKTTAILADQYGVADFPILRPGTGYGFEVSFPGFNTIRQKAVRVRINDSQTYPVQMMIEFQERVKVTASTDVIDITTTRQSSRFSEDFISDLPVPGRFYQNVLTMAPGVQDADGDGNPNVHGSRSRDFQAIVTGVSNVDPLTGRWMARINPNSIEEMEIVTAGAGVEFGRAQGGFARIIQKQGSNRHEGVFEFYYRTSKLDGTGARDESGLPDAEYDWYQPAVQFSGPIIRDKFWYRASLEFRDISIPVNTGARIQLTEVEDQTNDFQLTWQVSPRNKLALNYRQDPRLVTNLGISNLVDARSSFGFNRETQTTSLTWTAPYSPRILVENTISWQDQNLSIFPTTVGANNDCVAGLDFLSEARCFNSDTGQVTGSYNTDQNDHRQRLTFKGKATLYGGSFLGATHRVKLGAQGENERYFRELLLRPTAAYFVVNAADDDPTGGGGELEPFGIAIVNIAVPQADDVRATGTNWGVYAEDQFKPIRNLTMTIGARVDREEIRGEGREKFDPVQELAEYMAVADPFVDPRSPSYASSAADAVLREARRDLFTGFEAFETFESQMKSLVCTDGGTVCPTDVALAIDSAASEQKSLNRKRRAQDLIITNTNVSPYFALAWDPFNNGKSAFKLSAGRHYNNIPLIIPLQELEPAETTLLYRIELGGPQAGNTTLQNGVNPAVNINIIAPDLATPYQDEFTVSFERELWAETSINLTYIARRYRDQLQDRNINIAEGDLGVCAFQTEGGQPTILPSWGEGFDVTDPHTQETYEDTDAGRGDGRTDDCIGNIENYGGATVSVVQRPDGHPDLYKQNPFWGDIFEIGNFNEIDYDALVFEVVRRQYRSWELQGSYTYSEAIGDGEDFNQGFDDDPSVLNQDIRGYQSYDQRHVVKVNATTITPWGIRLGTAASWQSGLPYSVILRQPAFDILPRETAAFGVTAPRSRIEYSTGGRNDQRNDSYWNVDLKATKEFNMAKGINMLVSAEVYNILDNDTYQIYNPDLERGVQINGVNEARRIFGRQWQIGFRLAF